MSPESKDLLKRWLNPAHGKDPLPFQVVFPPNGASSTLDSKQSFQSTVPKVVFPGAFNPLHDAHRAMANIATAKTEFRCWFEISVKNVDKQPLDWPSLKQRIEQKFPPHGLIVSRAATFLDKSRCMPNSVFVIGADTILRIADLKYYNESESQFQAAIAEIKNKQCRFLVFGRKISNIFVDNQNIQLGECLADICTFVEQSDFQHDISSTQLRFVDYDKQST